MNTAAVTAIVQSVVALAGDIPNIVSVIEGAINASKAGTGPTDDQIAAALSAAEATDAQIQAS